MLRFSCEKALLQSAVNTTSRAVAAKSSIPALEGILLEGGDTADPVRLQHADRHPHHRGRPGPVRRAASSSAPGCSAR